MGSKSPGHSLKDGIKPKGTPSSIDWTVEGRQPCKYRLGFRILPCHLKLCDWEADK